MGDVAFDLAGMAALADAARTVAGTLDGLGHTRHDDAAMGGAVVADGCDELQTGWTLQRAQLVARLDLLAGFADAVQNAARDVEATVVLGEA